MKPSALYVLGGAATGKSTFTGQLLTELGDLGPFIDLHQQWNAKNLVTLRGHEVAGGLYLGKMRDEFPGTDGLDRTSSPVLESWLSEGGAGPYRFVLGEGATLATRRALTALGEHCELLVFHLYASDEVRAERCELRGSNQPLQFIRATATRARNRANEVSDAGGKVSHVWTDSDEEWATALTLARLHLEGL